MSHNKKSSIVDRYKTVCFFTTPAPGGEGIPGSPFGPDGTGGSGPIGPGMPCPCPSCCRN